MTYETFTIRSTACDKTDKMQLIEQRNKTNENWT